jgi:hypothetical protein
LSEKNKFSEEKSRVGVGKEESNERKQKESQERKKEESNERKKEERKQERKSSFYAKTSKVKRAMLYTNKLDPFLPSSVSLLQDYDDTFPKEVQELRWPISELFGKGHMRESMSPCAVPVLLIPTKHGMWRRRSDCRALNNIAVKYCHLVSRLNDMLDELHGSCIFSKIDLSCMVLAFLPYGLTNAPSTFLIHMSHVLRAFIGKFVAVSFEDILIYGKHIGDHVVHLKSILNVLRQGSLFANLKTCTFYTDKRVFVGFAVIAQVIQVAKGEVRAIQDWSSPTSVGIGIGAVFIRDGPFQVLERINDNTYKPALPGEYNVSATFKVTHLRPFDVGDDLRTNPFQERGNDVNLKATPNTPTNGPMRIPIGPVTRVKARRFKDELDPGDQGKRPKARRFKDELDPGEHQGIKVEPREQGRSSTQPPTRLPSLSHARGTLWRCHTRARVANTRPACFFSWRALDHFWCCARASS